MTRIICLDGFIDIHVDLIFIGILVVSVEWVRWVYVRVMGLKWLVFSIKPLCLIGIWFGDDQRADIIKTHVAERSDYVFKYQ